LPPRDPLAAGRDALTRGAWAEARALFDEALETGDSPEGWEGLGTAASWLEDFPASLRARERAYVLYRQRGDRLAAARMATWLASDYTDYRGELAVANGWLRRAERLLEGLPPSPEHGWLVCLDAHTALMSQRDPPTARRLAAQAASIARSIGAVDLEMLAVALEGLAMVSDGDVSAGMGRLDEATAAATGGELTDLTAIGTACCYLIRACELVRDYDRAAQWCGRVKEFCERWNFGTLFSVCRNQYAALLIWRGEWDDAEREFETLRRHVEQSQPRLVPLVDVRLAEIRRRQGRWDEADALFARGATHTLALLGRAALALDRGETAQAVEHAEAYLRRIGDLDRAERAAGLELLARAHAALGDVTAAGTRADELRAIAELVATEPLRAAAAYTEGVVLTAAGDHAAGALRLEEAASLFERNRSPFEAARARLALARTLLRLDRRDPAAREAATAAATFSTLGASRDAEAATQLLGEAKGKPARSPLTRRELDVLRLVAQGSSDREAATRLGLSEHTVHRHVANILTKTGQRSRTAAVAYAAKHDLL
jgi:LuxR family maltose regulon positive regulatory protein